MEKLKQFFKNNMNRIKVKNFGAIKEGGVDDWIELNQTTIFYGEPNTGKTTILKLIALNI